MKNIKYIFFASLLVSALNASAQETYQDTKLTAGQLTGTARYVGMGGAMEALGADISTISTNPAGVGLFSKTSVSVTAGVQAQTDAHDYVSFDNSKLNFDGKQSHPTFDQIGFVWSQGSANGRNRINLAFNYHKSTDFGQILTAANYLNGASQNKLTAVKNYEGVPGWSALDSNYGGYKDQNGRYNQGLLNVYTDGNLLYEGAHSFLFGQYQHGYIGEYDFNISGSLHNRVWLGLTIGLHDVNYHSNSVYAENLLDGNSAVSYEQTKIDGTGFDIKAGVIFRPVENSPFRIGLYFNTPIFYDLKLRGANDVSIYGGNAPGQYKGTGEQAQAMDVYAKGDKGQSADYDFRLNSPWKVGASLGHTLGSQLAIGATYEYAWYSHTDNRVKNGGYYDYYYGDYYESSSSDEVMNRDTRLNLKGVSTLKLGLEYKPISMLALRLGYNYVSPMFKDNAYRDVSLNSNGVYSATSTDYTNWKATNRITAGLGFNYQKFSIDVAYQYSQQDGDFYAFMPYNNPESPELSNVSPATKVSNKRHQVLLTVGYKF